MSETIDLGTFDGLAVRATGVAVTNAGDGLSDAMKTEPVILHNGDTVYVVLECEVGKITHVPVKDGDGWKRIHQLKAGVATIVDEAAVKAAIDVQRARIEQARLVAKGILKLPGMLVDEHDRGEHEFIGPVEGCAVCDEQLDAAAAFTSPEQEAADELATKRKAADNG